MVALRLLVAVGFLACAAVGATASQGSGSAFAQSGWIAFERQWIDQQASQGYYWIAVARADGRAQRDVTSRPKRGEAREDHFPVWSQGGRIAFVRTRARSTELMIARPSGWRVQKVSSLGRSYPVDLYAADNAPVWSPDEQSIAWTPGRDLFLVDVAQRTRRRLAGPSCAARWSTDGRSLLYLGGSCIEAPHHPYVAVVSLATGSRRVIARGSFNSADWSPDGRRIAYAGACDSGPGDDPWCEVFLSNADGSGFRKLRLPPKAGVVDWVRWTDASTVVSGGTGPDERVGLTRFEVDKNTAAALAPGQIYIWPTAPAVTADGIIGVIQRFGPRTGRPALVNTRTGEVQWGQVPKGWAGDAAAIHDT